MAVGFLLMICAGILSNYYSTIVPDMSNFQFNAIAIAFVAIILNEIYNFWGRTTPKAMPTWGVLVVIGFGFFAFFGLSFHPDVGGNLFELSLKVKAAYAMLYAVGLYFVAIGARNLVVFRQSEKVDQEAME